VSEPVIALVASRPLGPDWPKVRKWKVLDEDAIDGVELDNIQIPGETAFAHRATSGLAEWQVTWFDDRGPGGDSRRRTLEQALNYAAPPTTHVITAIHLKGERMTRNPAAPAAARTAIDKYREFHRKDPKVVGEFAKGFAIPTHVLEVGDAKNVLYRSDKIDPETLEQPTRPINYIHDHDPGVCVYEPCDDDDADATEVPYWVAECEALVLLGTCLGFAFQPDGGELVEARVRAPRPQLYTTPDGRALLVIQSKRKVLAMMWGGSLGVEDRGIVG
jgi:hypothetical protein